MNTLAIARILEHLGRCLTQIAVDLVAPSIDGQATNVTFQAPPATLPAEGKGAFTPDGAAGSILPDGRPTHRLGMAALRAYGATRNVPFTAKDVAAAHGLPVSSVRSLLSRGALDGVLVRAGYGRYALAPSNGKTRAVSETPRELEPAPVRSTLPPTSDEKGGGRTALAHWADDNGLAWASVPLIRRWIEEHYPGLVPRDSAGLDLLRKRLEDMTQAGELDRLGAGAGVTTEGQCSACGNFLMSNERPA